MSNMQIEILIPLAGSGKAAAGAVYHLQAVSEPDAPAESGGFHPTIAPLKGIRLHKAGQMALDRVNTLRVPRKPYRLPRLTTPRRRQSRLKPLIVAEAVSLDANNAKSAELGLALGLLALERGTGNRLVIATGALSSQAVDGVSAYDTPVLPVAGLAQKFDAIALWLENHRPMPGSQSVEVMVPLTDLDGQPVQETYAEDIARLVARAKDVGTKLKLVPVASLAAAASRLGALTARGSLREAGAWMGVAASVLLACVVLAAQIPVPPQPAPLTFFEPDDLETPVIMQMSSEGLVPKEDMCPEGIRPTVSERDILTMHYETAPTFWPASAYQVAFVLIGEQSAFKVFQRDALEHNDMPKKLENGAIEFSFAIAIEDAVEEEIMVIALARPLLPFRTDHLFTILGKAVQNNADNRLNAQQAALENVRGALVWHHFDVVQEAETCSEDL